MNKISIYIVFAITADERVCSDTGSIREHGGSDRHGIPRGHAGRKPHHHRPGKAGIPILSPVN